MQGLFWLLASAMSSHVWKYQVCRCVLRRTGHVTSWGYSTGKLSVSHIWKWKKFTLL